MRVEQQHERLSAPSVLTGILNEFSAISDYRTLRDSLSRRLTGLLKCQYVLFYRRIGESLQFAAGTFDEKPGWSASLLAVAHINPIDLSSDRPEARAWRNRHAAVAPVESPEPTLVAAPLIYRQRVIGILVAIRNGSEYRIPSIGYQGTAGRGSGGSQQQLPDLDFWSQEEIQIVEAAAGVIALLLENTRLLEHDRERIHELSLLNSIGSQINCSMHELERLRSVVIQRVKEISSADLCELLLPSTPSDSSPWITSALREKLLRYIDEQRKSRPLPLVIERPGDAASGEYLDQLPASIKTFFALPLVSGAAVGKRGTIATARGEGETKVLGLVVGACYHPWKLRHEELMMLQVLASQASAALENIHLVMEVVEARNEARKLLRQVLDDQRLKELILESIPSGLITIDLEGRVMTFNRAAEVILGYHPYEVLGQTMQKILNHEGCFSFAYDAASPKKGRSETLITLNRQGQEVVLDVTLQPLRNDRGAQIGTMATFTDVTTMRRLEEEKRRLDHLASLGKMAASVAHEVRNPLASIKITMQMLMADLAKESALDEPLSLLPNEASSGTRESIAVVLKEVERLDNIVRDLLLFAKPRQLHRVPCDLLELNEHVLHIMRTHLAEAGVELHRVYHVGDERRGREIPLMLVDVEQVEQVLFNLYTNALQAMPEGGVLTVSFQIVHAPAPGNVPDASAPTDLGGHPACPEQYPSSARTGNTVKEARAAFELGPLQSSFEEQDWLELSVSDTGVGIPPNQLELIFQPFFTTKAHGIGLGLPITQRLVEDHHGHILVESRLGYGATFSVRFPLSIAHEETLERLSDGRDMGL